MSSPSGEIGDVVKEISGKASSESVSKLRQEVEEVSNEVNEKAPKVGYAPELKVKFAKELVGRGESTPEVIGAIRPTGVRSIGDGNATIERIKGESVVWNQHVPYDVTKWGIRYSNTISFKEGVLRTDGSAPYLRCLFNNIEGHKLIIITEYRTDGALFGIYTYGTNDAYAVYKTNDEEWVSYKKIITAKKTEGIAFASNGTYLELRNFLLIDLTQMFGAGNEPTTIEDFEARKPLGVGNEYNEGTIVSFQGGDVKSVGFNAWDEEWEVGKINTLNGANEETTTFKRSANYTELVKNTNYRCTYTNGTSDSVWMMFFDLNGNPIEYKVGGVQVNNLSNVKNVSFVTPNQDCKVRFYVKNEPDSQVCIHLAHSGYRNGDYEPYVDDIHPLPNISAIKDADGNQLFPYGLLSAGSVHDEITATKAIKRIGVVDMGMFGWRTNASFNCWVIEMPNDYKHGTLSVGNCVNKKYPVEKYAIFTNSSIDKVLSGNKKVALFVRDSSYTSADEFKQAMSGVLLYYELAEPIEVNLPEPLNMTYEAWDFGTEELVAKGATTPLNADIVYQFNAVDRIRENSSAIEDLEEHVEERKDDGIELLTNGNLKLTLKGETREFMPATPSGDPMHYAYVSAGAEYNATTDYILKNTPWKDMVDTVEDKAKWGLDVVDASKVKQMTIKGVVYNYATENRTSPEGGTYLRYFLVGKGSNNRWVEDETKVLHLPKCWYLNGLGDITDAEMRRILENKFIVSVWEKSRAIQSIKARTLLHPYTLPYTDGIGAICNLYGVMIESLILGRLNFGTISNEYCILTASSVVGNQKNLKYIACTKKLTSITHNNIRVLTICNITESVTISSPVISKESVRQNIQNAAPTSAITITLHADAYARLAEDADIVAALEAKPLVTLVSA